MTTLREAAQQALEFAADIVRGKYKGNAEEIRDALRAALEQPSPDAIEQAQAHAEAFSRGHDAGWQSAAAHYAALEQQEQEPVAWMGTSGVGETIVCKKRIFSFMSTPLYTHPKRRSWQGLTEEEHEKASHVCQHVGVEGLVLWLEDKLKERNA